MRSHIIKQDSTTDAKNPVPFKNWVVAHADRIPERAVTIDTDELEKHEKPGFNYRQVINRKKTRVASRRVSVNMLPSTSMNLGHASNASRRSEESSDEDEAPFGLSREEYSELREQWEAEQREKMEAERERIRTEGYDEGYETAAAEAEKEIEELQSILTNGLEKIEARWSAQLEEIEPHLGQLALEIAERILDAPLPEAIHEGVTAAIHDAIDEVAGETRTDVTLHPADYMRLKETGLLEQLNTAYESLHWHSDPELEQRGNWIVETPKAAIRHIKKELLADVEQTLELP